MIKPMRILCVGRVYCDLVFSSPSLPKWGEETFSKDFGCMAGGGAFITAAYLSAFGHSVRLAGQVGAEEPFGQIIHENLRECNIDGSLLQSGSSAQLTVAVAGEDDRAFLTHRDPARLVCPTVSDFDHLHIGELNSLLECPELVTLAKRAGATLSCDCGYESHYSSRCEDLLSDVDVFLPSKSEYLTLKKAGINLSDHSHLVVKQGSEGAKARINGNWYSEDAQQTDIVDPTGAGDAFNSGYLHAWLSQKTTAESLKLGAICGAAAISSLGGWNGRKQIEPEMISSK